MQANLKVQESYRLLRSRPRDPRRSVRATLPTPRSRGCQVQARSNHLAMFQWVYVRLLLTSICEIIAYEYMWDYCLCHHINLPANPDLSTNLQPAPEPKGPIRTFPGTPKLKRTLNAISIPQRIQLIPKFWKAYVSKPGSGEWPSWIAATSVGEWLRWIIACSTIDVQKISKLTEVWHNTSCAKVYLV